MSFVTPVMEHWLEQELAQSVNYIQPITDVKNKMYYLLIWYIDGVVSTLNSLVSFSVQRITDMSVCSGC